MFDNSPTESDPLLGLETHLQSDTLHRRAAIAHMVTQSQTINLRHFEEPGGHKRAWDHMIGVDAASGLPQEAVRKLREFKSFSSELGAALDEHLKLCLHDEEATQKSDELVHMVAMLDEVLTKMKGATQGVLDADTRGKKKLTPEERAAHEDMMRHVETIQSVARSHHKKLLGEMHSMAASKTTDTEHRAWAATRLTTIEAHRHGVTEQEYRAHRLHMAGKAGGIESEVISRHGVYGADLAEGPQHTTKKETHDATLRFVSKGAPIQKRTQPMPPGMKTRSNGNQQVYSYY